MSLSEIVLRSRSILRTAPPNLIASALMILSFFTFVGVGIVARVLSKHVPVIEIVMFRQGFSLLLLAPVLIWKRETALSTRGFKLHLVRGFLSVFGMCCGIAGVVFLPFADATAISMAEVLFVTALAAILLREHVGWRRWVATAVGFVGVIVMLRPFSAGVDVFALVALLGSLAGAGVGISIRMAPTTGSTLNIMFWQNALVILFLAIPVAIWGTFPRPDDWVLIFGMAMLGVAGQWLFSVAMRIGEASAVAPLHYVRLLLMTGTGFILYGEVPTWATFMGTALIVLATAYTMHRNAVRRTPVVVPPAGPGAPGTSTPR